MTYICYVETETSAVPHMEPLAAETLEAARDEVRRLLRSHTKPKVVRLYLGDTPVETTRVGKDED